MRTINISNHNVNDLTSYHNECSSYLKHLKPLMSNVSEIYGTHKRSLDPVLLKLKGWCILVFVSNPAFSS